MNIYYFYIRFKPIAINSSRKGVLDQIELVWEAAANLKIQDGCLHVSHFCQHSKHCTDKWICVLMSNVLYLKIHINILDYV